MASAIAEPIVPTKDQQPSLARVHEALGRSFRDGAAIVGPSGEKTPIPEPLYEVLIQAVRELERGRAITVVSADKELSTQQAADLLNISRPFLIRLLDAGQIPYRKVGTHRRLALVDVLTYRQSRSKERKTVLGELAREAQKSATYE